MREAAFVKQNKDKWSRFENVISNKVRIDTDELAQLYVEVSDDLSYAQTFYPGSNTVEYLNMLSASAHLKLYKTKKESSHKLLRFYSYEFPLFFHQYQKQLLLAFGVFALFLLLGILSLIIDDTFVRAILGNGYVDMTLENIEKGDPMAVYKSKNKSDMFLGITLNNIRVAVFTFITGLLFGLGTIYIMMANGLMLGVFQYFFYEQGLLWESARTIWIHGTIEISVIIIAGCAGLVLGRSILFPGTYTRLQSFTKGMKDGLKILVSTLPFFIIAGFLESYVTRHTQMPDFLAILIILGSLGLILFYYVFYPRYLAKKHLHHEQ